VLAGVDGASAGELGALGGSERPAANISGVRGTGGPAGVAFDPMAGVLALWSADAVSAGVGAAGMAMGMMAARAAAAAADWSDAFVWSVCEEDFEELALSPEPVSEFESAEPEVVWALSLLDPLADWP